MGAWIAHAGAVSDDGLLKRLLGGGQTETRAGDGWGLGIRNTGGESARLSATPDGKICAAIGSEDGGSSAVVMPEGALTLACDPFGLHGVYTTMTEGVFWASSDLRLLQNIPGVSRKLSPAALHGYLCFSYVPTPHTMIAGCSALPAGHKMTITRGQAEKEGRGVWQEQDALPRDEGATVADLRTRLQETVTRHLGNERDVGVFLSGGLDSSLMAALLSDAGARVHLFTLDFGPPFNAEVCYARQVAQHLKQSLHVVPAGPGQIRSALDVTAAALQQPFGDGVVVPLYLLGQAARAQGLGVVFNGEGGDQLFGGWANKPMIAAEIYGGKHYDREAAYLATFHRFWGLTDKLYTAEARAAAAKADVGAWVRPALEGGHFPSLMHRLRAANLQLKGAQNIAPRAVQLTAAHGLCVRMPFFDRSLTEWTFALPPEWFLHGTCEKYALKRVAEAFLPSEIIWREKRGMGVPMTEWCLGPLRRELARRMSTRRLKVEGLFDPGFVARLCDGEDQSGEIRRRRVGEKLWALLMFHAWRETRSRSRIVKNGL